MLKENRMYAIALNGCVIYGEMLEAEMLWRYEELMEKVTSSSKVEVFQYVTLIPCTGYKIVEE